MEENNGKKEVYHIKCSGWILGITIPYGMET
jgi:hypothetical protein